MLTLPRIVRALEWAALILIAGIVLGGSSPFLEDPGDRTRAYTRSIEFDYVTWTARAFWTKIQQASLGTPHYFDPAGRKQVVMEYLRLTERIQDLEWRISLVYSDPAVPDPLAASADLRAELAELIDRQRDLAPLAEAVLQEQVTSVLSDLGLTSGGQPIPPVLYHVTELPFNLIVSPRDRIQQEASVSLLPGLTVQQAEELERQVAEALDASTLVVPVGGIGVYPTMVMRTTHLPWLLETVAHEWVHNFLIIKPLGMLYEETPELRTMNETTASLAGTEISAAVLRIYYPELAGLPSPPLPVVSFPAGRADPNDIPLPVFDFRAEMHTTRVTVDALLAEGRIEEAEAYMEARRAFFWDHGYPIRKLNQAYFAFYGAYADVPGGAAGQDPVGPAVRALRDQSDSLADFLRRIAWMTSFDELQQAVGPLP